MKTYASSYVVALAALLGLDAVWLSTMAERFYRPMLGDLLARDFEVLPALLFYALYVFGVVFLAVVPALRLGGWRTALINGAVLGLVAYGTYDLTNQATLRNWPAIVTALDLAWGTFLTSASSVAGYCAGKATFGAGATR